MGYYDPPDSELPTEEVWYENPGLELTGVLQILALKDDNLEEVVKENLAPTFVIPLYGRYEIVLEKYDVWIDERKTQVVEEYPDGRVLYQCEATFYCWAQEFDYDCSLDPIYHETDPDGEINELLVSRNPNGGPPYFLPKQFKNGQDIIDSKCKFIKVLSLTFVKSSFRGDYEP